MKTQYIVSLLFLIGVGTLLVTIVSGTFTADAFNPVNAAERSDLIVHGTVTDIGNAGWFMPDDGQDVYHPVTISVKDTFKGVQQEKVTFNVRGGKFLLSRSSVMVSTAASFSEGEEVVMMLQERNGTYYAMGQPGKYKVTNGSVQVMEPERKRITVEELRTLVQDTGAEVVTLDETQSSPGLPVKQVTGLLLVAIAALSLGAFFGKKRTQ